jgi:ATPase
MKIVPDTSVIVDGRVTKLIKNKKYQNDVIIIPEAVLAELESQANHDQEIGFSGLEEIQKLKKFAEKEVISLKFKGSRPNLEQIKLASGGEIDALIRDLALQEKAVLLTSDYIQAEVGKAKGLKVEYLRPEKEEKQAKVKKIWDFFDEKTMSVHLREDTQPSAKTGTPGNFQLEKVSDKTLSREEIEDIAQQIVETARRSKDGFIEFDKGGGTIVQLKNVRIVISRPPFSDGFEISAVKPIKTLTLDDYHLSDELLQRVEQKRRGILVAGAPGAGKSTFAQAVAEHLLTKKYIIKTIEKPRDLQVSQEITQYTFLDGSLENTAELLLLVRPDYTVFDEVRKTNHFQVFADMRLSGVGMIGVTHANRAIDALQRLLGRVELGMIPQVVDTIIFIQGGEVSKVYEIEFTVKVPAGMSEEDLARPVIEVSDFNTKKAEYEIYSYGDQIAVMELDKIKKTKTSPLWNLAAIQIEKQIRNHVKGPVTVEVTGANTVTVYVKEKLIPRLIGRQGETISSIEKNLGLHIDVQSFKGTSTKKERSEKPINPKIQMDKDKIILISKPSLAGKEVEVFANKKYLTTATVGKDGSISIRKTTKAGKLLVEHIQQGSTFELR